ncbi:unnamed protein product [Arctogadus glacialis]
MFGCSWVRGRATHHGKAKAFIAAMTRRAWSTRNGLYGPHLALTGVCGPAHAELNIFRGSRPATIRRINPACGPWTRSCFGELMQGMFGSALLRSLQTGSYSDGKHSTSFPFPLGAVQTAWPVQLPEMSSFLRGSSPSEAPSRPAVPETPSLNVTSTTLR